MPVNTFSRRIYRTPFSKAYWHQAFSELKNTRMLVFAALILALRIAMKPLKIPVAADINITFGFIANAFGSMVYGPVIALISGAISDTLGYLVAPGGVYYFPFILLEMAGSFVFAIFLYSTEVTAARLILSKFCVNLFVNILLNEPIMVKYYELFFTTAYQPFIWIRIVKNIAMLPIESVILIFFFRAAASPLVRLKYIRPGMIRIAFNRKHIALIAALLVIGVGSIAGYVIYDYNTKSFSASYTAAERLSRNREMNAWVAEKTKGGNPEETVTIIESARSKVGSREMTYELAIYRIDPARLAEKQKKAEQAVLAGEEAAVPYPYTADTLQGYSKSKAARDDTLIRIGSGKAVTDKNTGERISLELTWNEGEQP